ncbi:MAG: hypothetical protein ACRBCL_14915 [Maritimibacter sp.]
MFGIMNSVIRTATRRETPQETRFEKERTLRNAGRAEDRRIELEQHRATRTRFWI